MGKTAGLVAILSTLSQAVNPSHCAVRSASMSSPQTTLLATWREPGEVAVRAAWARRVAGADLRTTVEAGLIACELDDELLAIGLGALPNAEGDIELDASMMDGATLAAGAVCAVRDI